MTPRPLAFLLLLAALGGGCTEPLIGGPCQAFSQSSDPGAICKQQFYFPAGLAIDPAADALYVSNGNADLRYSGGSVSGINLARYACAYAFARQGLPADPPQQCRVGGSRGGAVRFPHLICAMRFAAAGFPGDFASTHPGCSAADAAAAIALIDRFNSGTNANRDRINKDRAPGVGICRPDVNDPTILECDEQLLIDSAVRVGNFAGELRVRGGPPAGAAAGCDASARRYLGPGGVPLCLLPRRRVFLAVRGDPSITFIDVAHPAEASESALLSLGCGGPQPQAGDLAEACVSQRITVRDIRDPSTPGSYCQGPGNNPNNCVTIPGEPFGLALDQGLIPPTACSDGSQCDKGQCRNRTACSVETLPYERLLVSHLSGGEVTLIDASLDNPASLRGGALPPQQVVLDVRGGFFNQNGAIRGAFALAPQTPGVARGLWYMTSRVNPFVATFRIANGNVILNAGSFPVNIGGGGPYNLGSDVRGLAFDPCTDAAPGCRGFFIDNQPPTVFTVDTRVDPGGMPAGVPRNVVSDIVDACQGPSHLAFRRLPDAPLDGTVRNRVFVLCYDSSSMAIIDPDIARLIDIVPVGRGANAIAFNFGPDIAVAGAGSPGHTAGPDTAARGVDDDASPAPVAYVTNFLDMTVSVIDLEPGSATENRVIGRIGITDPPVTN